MRYKNSTIVMGVVLAVLSALTFYWISSQKALAPNEVEVMKTETPINPAVSESAESLEPAPPLGELPSYLTETPGSFSFENNTVRVVFPTEYQASEDGAYVEFGPMTDLPEAPIGEKGYGYTWAMTRARSVQAIQNEIDQDDLILLHGIIEVNGHQVVLYNVAGLCAYPTVEVVSEESNYIISPRCGAGRQEEYDYMLNVVRSMQWK